MTDSFFEDGDDEALAEINMIPLIDIMLVLLVIFIIAAPLLSHAVKLDLPAASAVANRPETAALEIAIDAQRQVFWAGSAVNADELASRLAAAGAQQPLPELQLRADRATPYEAVAELLASAGRAGLTRIAFVTLPAR